jgi:hypothetical protein
MAAATEATAAPLPFSVDPVQPPRLSMSFLRAAGGCLRRAHYERISSSRGRDATIGRIIHEIQATVGFAVTIRGDTHPRDGEVTAIARRVLATPEEHEPLPRDIWDEVLGLVAKWEPAFRAGERFEVTMRHEHRGQVLSARIDRLWLSPDGRTAVVKDAKTGWADPPQKPTPTPQGDNYAWHVWREHPGVETVEFETEHIRFPGTGKPYTYELDEILLIDAWLQDAVTRIVTAYRKGGELPTNPGEACEQWGGCPVARDCPVKAWARPSTEIETEAHALSELEAIYVEEASIAARKKAIKGWLTREQRRALVHNGREIGFNEKAGTKTDWKGLALSLDGDPSDFTEDTAPSFGLRKAKKESGT